MTERDDVTVNDIIRWWASEHRRYADSIEAHPDGEMLHTRRAHVVRDLSQYTADMGRTIAQVLEVSERVARWKAEQGGEAGR